MKGKEREKAGTNHGNKDKEGMGPTVLESNSRNKGRIKAKRKAKKERQREEKSQQEEKKVQITDPRQGTEENSLSTVQTQTSRPNRKVLLLRTRRGSAFFVKRLNKAHQERLPVRAFGGSEKQPSHDDTSTTASHGFLSGLKEAIAEGYSEKEAKVSLSTLQHPVFSIAGGLDILISPPITKSISG